MLMMKIRFTLMENHARKSRKISQESTEAHTDLWRDNFSFYGENSSTNQHD